MLLDGERAAIPGKLNTTKHNGGRAISYRNAHFVKFRNEKIIDYVSTDASSDKFMTLNFGGSAGRNCQKQDVRNNGGTITVDSVCTFGDSVTTSHAVVSGDFNSAYFAGEFDAARWTADARRDAWR